MRPNDARNPSPSPTGIAPADLAGMVEEVFAFHTVPGVSVAVLAGGQVATAAAGVLNLETAVTVTTDSLFQIGSITKPYTASLVMQLVDEGRVDLDEPARAYLPELKLADPKLTDEVTPRQLLTHTSGIAGDHFPDLGRGDDAVRRYVASCADIGKTHPLGATTSYCNAGFVIAGRIVERVTKLSWDDALATRLLAPLGVRHTFTLPEDVLRFRAATGHLERDGRLQPVSQWSLPRSCGPCGLICATAADVVAFARMHLDEGRAGGGSQVLSSASAEAMLEPQAPMPDPYVMGSHFGLSWMLYRWSGRRVYGHDGSTIGQTAFLRVVPDAGIAIAVLTNGGDAKNFFEDLARQLLDDLVGISVPLELRPTVDPVDVDVQSYVGVYERLGSRVEITQGSGGPMVRSIATGPLANLFPDQITELDLVAIRPDLFVTRRPRERSWTALLFYRLEDGSPYLHTLARAMAKLS